MTFKNVYPFLMLLVFLVGCGGVNLDSINDIPGKPDVTIQPMGKDAKLTLYWLFNGNKNSELYRTVRSISKIEAAIGEWSDDNVAEIKVVKASYTPSKDDKDLVSYFAQSNLNLPKDFSDNTPIFIKFTAGEQVYKYVTTIKNATPNKEDKTSALALVPYFEKSLRGLNISTLVFRKFSVSDEYHPDGEKYRVRVYNENGKNVWASDFDANFTQAIEKVKPQEVGANYLYNQYWDGKDLNGDKADPGVYEFRITIPAFPIPYQTSVYYQWGN